MTAEEAIKLIGSMKGDLYDLGLYDDNELTALEMAISALSESKGDLISRRDAIDALIAIMDKPNHADFLYTDEICKALGELPSVENKGEWIPVSERLPEDQQNILFSTKTDRVFEGRYFDDNTGQQWYAFRDDCFAWNNVVTAWMPLPEPYKESEGMI